MEYVQPGKLLCAPIKLSGRAKSARRREDRRTPCPRKEVAAVVCSCELSEHKTSSGSPAGAGGAASAGARAGGGLTVDTGTGVKENGMGRRKNPPEEFNAWMKPYQRGTDTYWCVYAGTYVYLSLYITQSK